MQILTVCRIGTEWAFRDVTGETYGHSPDIHEVLQTAQILAARRGSRVVFSVEAEQHFRSLNEVSLDTQQPEKTYSAASVAGFIGRITLRASRRSGLKR